MNMVNEEHAAATGMGAQARFPRLHFPDVVNRAQDGAAGGSGNDNAGGNADGDASDSFGDKAAAVTGVNAVTDAGNDAQVNVSSGADNVGAAAIGGASVVGAAETSAVGAVGVHAEGTLLVSVQTHRRSQVLCSAPSIESTADRRKVTHNQFAQGCAAQWALALVDGALRLTMREQVQSMAHEQVLDMEDALGVCDGKAHEVALTFGAFGTRVYLDGYQCFSSASKLAPLQGAALLQCSEGVSAAWLPRALDSEAIAARYREHMAEPDIVFAANYVAARDLRRMQQWRDWAVHTRFRVRGPRQYGVIWALQAQGAQLQVSIDERGIALKVMDLLDATPAAATHAAPHVSHTAADSSATYATHAAHAPRAPQSQAQAQSPSQAQPQVDSHNIHDNDNLYAIASETTYMATGSWDDGEWHDLLVRAFRGAMEIYVHGSRMLHQPGQVSWRDIGEIQAFRIGEDLRGVRLMGEVRYGGVYGSVYGCALTQGQIQTLAEALPLTTTALFDKGYAGAASYRIPSLITARMPQQDTTHDDYVVIAGADQRQFISNDAPNAINFVIRRSLDGGASWLPMQTVLEYAQLPEAPASRGASAIDSCMVYDESMHRVTALIDHYPGGVGIVNNTSDIGVDEQGRVLLYLARQTSDKQQPSDVQQLGDERQASDTPQQTTSLDEHATASVPTLSPLVYVLNVDGSVVKLTSLQATLEHREYEPTEYRVDAQGYVTKHGEPAGNIYYAEGDDPQESLLEARTGFLLEMHSDDGGATWSRPRQLNHMLKEPWMRFLGTCPGNGIQLKHGEHAGRLLIPYYCTGLHNGYYASGVLYSDNHGVTWHRGDTTNNGKIINGKQVDPRINQDHDASTSESAVIERADGAVVLFSRNQHHLGRVATAVSLDGGQTWDSLEFDEALPEIFSQPNAINLPHEHDNHEDDKDCVGGAERKNGKDRVVFANASQMLPYRGSGVLRLSEDGGRTWALSRCFNPYHYVYQCMSVLPDGALGLVWERETAGVYFTRIPLQYLGL